ncbi:MAG: bacillithiol system redox-active protein YtxJ [Bacteroidia bacterium]
MPVQWKPLCTVSDLETAVYQSFDSEHRYVFIFKHSTRCSISRMALDRLERSLKANEPAYFLDLLNYRELSNLISERFSVQHESPQVLIIKNGECTLHASHNAITADLFS